MGINGEIPDVKSLRIPVKYLANLLTAGDTQPVERALERMLAMRAYQREKHVDGRINTAALDQVQMKQADVEGDVPRDGDCQLRGPLRDSQHPPRVCGEHLRPARGLRLFVWQRVLGRRQRSEPVRRVQKRRTIPIKAEV
jgi:hypothetical protein